MNKDLHDEIERISKESKDVLNESKTVDTACNDAFEVKQELSKRIVELEKDLLKSEAKGIAFEIVLQHKSRENNSLKTVQKENKNFMASLQLENAHLKQTYKDLFESVQRTAKFEAYFEKLENTKVILERQLAQSKLASQDIRSCQKEYHELRTSYNALKVLFDSLNRKKWNINVSKSSKPKESVSEKVHTGESSKTYLRRVSQFKTYSLQKDRKFSKKSQSFETLTPQKGFKTRASNAKNQSFETSHSRFTPVKQVWRPKQSHSKSFKYSKSEMLSMQNKNDSVLTINKKGRFSNDTKTNFQNVSSNENDKCKSSSSTRFKTLHETPRADIMREDVADSLHVPLNGYSSEQKQFSLMWLASSFASSTSLILLLLLLLLLLL
ncbi:hypothetical protein Tco_0884420 [Tanacetum coccineum]